MMYRTDHLMVGFEIMQEWTCEPLPDMGLPQGCAQTCLAPGRDLDVKVAEALGYTDVLPDCYWFDGKDTCGTIPGGRGGWCDTGRTSIRRYSTVAGQSGMLLRYLSEQGISVQYPEQGDDGRWFCSTAADPPVLALGETAAHVICLVFLAAWPEGARVALGAGQCP